MAFKKFSQITLAAAPPATTDTIIGVGGGTTDLQYTVAQLITTMSSGLSIGTTAIVGGTNTGDILYNSGPGTLQEAHDVKYTGSGNISLTTVNSITIDHHGDPATSFAIGAGIGGTFPANSYTIALGQGVFGSGVMTINSIGNIGIGASALQAVTDGQDNVIVGRNAGQNITTGLNNVCFGHQAGQGITTGQANFCIGAFTLGALASGSSNVALGVGALASAVGVSDCIAIGGNTLQFCGDRNVGLGKFAGQNCAGTSNIFIGYQSGGLFTNGNNNIVIGNWVGTATSVNGICAFSVSGNPDLDFNVTNANKWTFAENINIATLTTPGLIVNDSSGNISPNTSAAIATVPVNFTADHRLQVNIAGTTYYVAMSTTPW